MPPEPFWMKVLDVGALHSHLIADQVQLVVKGEITREMGVGRKLWA